MVKVCLCMIVKNEAGIIRRCIDSALSVVDAICISDTGSTDNTVDIIKSYASDKLPVYVAHHQWKHFGHNRTLSHDETLNFCKSLGWDLTTSYALHLDADFKLITSPKFDKHSTLNPTTMMASRLIQVTDEMNFANIRFTRLDVPWKCHCTTHEYWATPGFTENDMQTFPRDVMYIDDVADGSSRVVKTERDIEYLEWGLKNDDQIHESRYLFYLGSSYKDSGENDKAIETLAKRICLPGWSEEIWYSHMTIAVCFFQKMLKTQDNAVERLSNYVSAISWFWTAFTVRPTRREPLVKLAHLYLISNKFYEVYTIVQFIKTIPYPKDDMLFVEDSHYTFMPTFLIAMVAYHLKKFDEGRLCAEQLLRTSTKLPAGIKESVMSILPNYVVKLPLDGDFKFDNIFENYFASSPSITDDYINVRHVNYYIDKDGKYIFPDKSGTIYTRNVLWDRKRSTLSNPRELVDDVNRYNGKIKGIEDIRLFKWDGELWGMGTSFQFTRENPNMVMFKVPTTSDNTIRHIYHIDFAPNGCEKNWAPIDSNTDELHVVYSHSPFVVLKFKKPTTDTEEHVNPIAIKQCKHRPCSLEFRGSSVLVKYKNGYISIVHEVSVVNEKRVYLHRFVRYSDEFQPMHVSQPFTFTGSIIEYVCGLSFDTDTSIFTIGYSIMDRESHLCNLREKELYELEWYSVDTGDIVKVVSFV